MQLDKLVVGIITIILAVVGFFVVRNYFQKQPVKSLPQVVSSATPTPFGGKSSISPSSPTPTPKPGSIYKGPTTKGGLPVGTSTTYTSPANAGASAPTYYFYQSSQSQNSSSSSGSQSQSGNSQTQTLPNGMTQSQSY